MMLGDDDALLPSCLARARRIAESWKLPDAIYTEALQFAYPRVIPDHPEAFIQTGYNEFFKNGAAEPFALAPEVAERLVRQAMQFRIRYGFNMQHFIISRRLVETLRPKGPFFQSPYPDYYAANAILLAARSVVANPRPLVLIGISPKSFGFYYHNRREREGVEFLQNIQSPEVWKRLRGKFVPGTNMNDSWLCAMETLALNFPERGDLKVTGAIGFCSTRRPCGSIRGARSARSSGIPNGGNGCFTGRSLRPTFFRICYPRTFARARTRR